MKFKLLILLSLPAFALNAQSDPAPTAPTVPVYTAAPKEKPTRNYQLANDGTTFAAGIKADDLKTLLYALAADSMQGRETGEEGQRIAAEFIAQQFKDAGLPPKGDKGFFQKIMLQSASWADIGLKVGDQEFRNRTDFYVYPAFSPDKPLTEMKDLMFVGYGIEDEKYNDYGKSDVAGKAVIFYNGEPMSTDGKSLITGTEFRSNWSIDWRRKVMLAKKKGAIAAFIIDPNFEESLKKNRKAISAYGWRPVGSDAESTANDFIPNMFVSPAVAKVILGEKAHKAESELTDLREGDKFKPVKVKVKIELRLDKESKSLEGSNVLAVIEGSDEKLKKEYVFVTAHYDHLGMSDSTVIYHGADDNASGTSGVIEIARAFAEAKKQGAGPKRTVVCMLVSGEEKGLLGSKYYTEFPLFPLDKTVVDINIDMIGRIDERHAGNPDYIYVIGSDRISTHLHDINEMVNAEHTKLELDYKYNAKDDPNHYYERSDHFNFAEKGIPVVFYFNGTHPDYHRPTDTADKINFDALAKRAQLAFYVAWEAANRPTRITANVPQDKKKDDMGN
ncbi:MAG: M28 family peptidase [Phycisphaerae bacterium]|nr:M28 family peptidase [Saprospiraceae bacterium]